MPEQPPDPGFRNPDGSASFDDLVRNLDYFDDTDYVVEVRRVLQHLIGAGPGMRLLDAGCGTGRDVASIASSAPGCEVVGIDISYRMVALARDRHGRVPGVEFRQGTMEALELPDAGLDAVWSMRTVQYLADPLAGVRELGRVTRPGGRVILIEGALSGTGLPESDLTRSVFGPRGGFGLQLPGLLWQAGLRDIDVRPAVGRAIGTPDPKVLEYARSQVAAALDAGLADEGEAERWLAGVEEQAREGRWFSIDCMLVVSGTVPAA